ncbi:hypothetical protein C9374_014091 [Naegleria lovaniensis]|uniref:Uncharacterized protein n=1 Tax=Naegleria lovaniensis TaxID=51637 RepID=A0AA88KQC1_NAELO|nr:uncharacterized protein C9374_014091 [Naegleria lovaniensis]KAG2389531.1 hypothetical protein C9374_014091 [Naegleria lovaniensis]
MACLLFILVLIVFFVSSYIEKTTTLRQHHDRVESFSEQYTTTTIHEEYSLPTNNHHQEQVQALNEHQVNNTTKATPSASHEKNESTLNFNHGTNSHTNQPPSMIVSTSSLRHNRSFTNEFNSSHNHDTKPFKTKTTPFSTMKWRQDQSLKYDHNKEKELNTHSNTHSSKFTLNSRQEFKKHLFGDFQCNRYGMRHGVGSPNLVPYSYSNIYLPPETLMASCKFENLCLTSEGEFVLFHSSDRLTTEEFYLNQFLNEFPWVYVQGSTVESNRGNFYVRVVDGDLVVNYHKSNVNKRSKIESMYMKSKALNCNARTNFSRGSSTTCRDLGLFSSMDFQNETLTPISISQNFTFYKKPVYAFKRYAAGNFGHVLSETLGMIMGLMQNFPHDCMDEDNHILYLDDVFDTSGTNWMASFRYDPHLATKLSIE